VRLHNVLEEKSRQMGMTWALAWAILWLIMYHPVSLLCIHEHLAELDDGGRAATIKSLFGRIRFMAKGELDPARPSGLTDSARCATSSGGSGPASSATSSATAS
jgi:hypothetical protein